MSEVKPPQEEILTNIKKLTQATESFNQNISRLDNSIQRISDDIASLKISSEARGMSSIRAENRVKRYYMSKTSIFRS